MVTGMSRHHGSALSDIEHVRQSLQDILSTPQGSRRMRPEYGSDLHNMVDLPQTRGWISAVQAEAARAIGRWEPRIQLKSVQVLSVLSGQITFAITAEYHGDALLLEVSI